MKLAKLIKHLTQHLAEHGNIEVKINCRSIERIDFEPALLSWPPIKDAEPSFIDLVS